MAAEEKKGKGAPHDSVGLITTVTVVVLAGGLVVPILGGSVGRTCGARTSVRLERERRSAEIQRALAERDAAQPPTPTAGE